MSLKRSFTLTQSEGGATSTGKRLSVRRAQFATRRAARKQSRLRGAILKAIKPELKQNRIVLSNASIGVANAATVFTLTTIAQGNDRGDRDGRKIYPQFLQTNEYFTVSQLGGTTQNTVFRRIIYIDWSYNSALLPTITDMLQGAAVRSTKNYDLIDRFEIIRDDTCIVNQGIGGGQFSHWAKQEYVDLRPHFMGKGRACCYNGPLNTDLVQGQVCIMYMASRAFVAVAGDQDGYNCEAALRFIDV